MNAPEDNPADDVEPTKEEWEAWQKSYEETVPIPVSPEEKQAIVNAMVLWAEKRVSDDGR